MRCPNLDELPPLPPGRTGWPWTEESIPMPDTMPDGRPWPKISVVTPSFNQGEFIEETIRSILLQGYPNMEYIIMDGGSTDGTVNIIRKYERWIAHWVSKPDRGQSHAINKGWKVATGDFVSWLNSDDCLMRDWAKNCALTLIENPETGLVCVDNLFVDSQSQPLWVFKGTEPVLDTVIVYWLCPFAQPGFLMRRSLLETCGFLDESLHLNMDLDYWVRLLMNGVKMRYTPSVLATCRHHAGAKTFNLCRNIICDRLGITEKFFRDAPFSLRSIATRARNRAYWNAAYNSFAFGDMEQARRYALEYLGEAGISALPKTLSLYTLSALGNRGRRILELRQAFRNFYRADHRTSQRA